MTRNRKYSPGMREQALRLLAQTRPSHPTMMSAVRHVAGCSGCAQRPCGCTDCSASKGFRESRTRPPVQRGSLNIHSARWRNWSECATAGLHRPLGTGGTGLRANHSRYCAPSEAERIQTTPPPRRSAIPNTQNNRAPTREKRSAFSTVHRSARFLSPIARTLCCILSPINGVSANCAAPAMSAITPRPKSTSTKLSGMGLTTSQSTRSTQH